MEEQWLSVLAAQAEELNVQELNAYTGQYGLTLSREDGELLMQEHKNALVRQKRIEFGESILPKLIYTFCDSDYLCQDNYVETLIGLQEIFFRYKNEMSDEITDDELLHFMKEQFDTVCAGDLDYLSGTCLEVFAQAVRAGYRDYRKTEGRSSYGELDEVTRWDRELYLEALKDLF